MTSELHTYLALVGNQRLEHFEEEIFADKTATTLYLHNLCRDLQYYHLRDSNAYLVYLYVTEVLHARWEPAEIIINGSNWHNDYIRVLHKYR